MIGGTALSMQIKHRISEDLDFVYPSVRLPLERIKALVREAGANGFAFVATDDPAAADDFEIHGMDLANYQQDYLVDGKVKVTFFAADAGSEKVMEQTHASTARVASLNEIFKLKALVSADRSKTRDWFDIYCLMRNHGFGIKDFCAAFSEAGEAAKAEIALNRICSGIPSKSDEGFESLVDCPPSVEQMRDFFACERNQFEVTQAKAARTQHNAPLG